MKSHTYRAIFKRFQDKKRALSFLIGATVAVSSLFLLRFIFLNPIMTTIAAIMTPKSIARDIDVTRSFRLSFLEKV